MFQMQKKNIQNKRGAHQILTLDAETKTETHEKRTTKHLRRLCLAQEKKCATVYAMFMPCFESYDKKDVERITHLNCIYQKMCLKIELKH